jgi:carbonic anhydrase
MPRTYATDSLPPTDAIARLVSGNQRFVRGEGRAVGGWRPGLADGQWPFAVILGCADSRAPAEYVFDQGLGDLFVIRVAGNIVAPSLVGSVEFAASNFGTRLVVVMGHTHCGAVAATLRTLIKADPVESRHVRSIVDFISPHVVELAETPMSDEARMALAVRVNAEASARELAGSSDLLRGLVAEGRIQIVPAVFDLDTGVVAFGNA